jgi:biotin transporter BioY
MYIIAIAWLYLVTLMAATETSITAGLLTFFFYGLMPCALLLWLLGVKHRRHMQAKKGLLQDDVSNPDGGDTNRNE